MRILKEFLNRYKRSRDPIAFYRKKGTVIGEHCEIRGSVNFGSEPYLISIGDHVRINNGVHLVTHDGGAWVLREYLGIENREQLSLFGKIQIGNNIHIGTNATIMPGVTIGNNCIVGCGAIVTHNVPDNSVVAGVPARIIETIDEYYQKHEKDFVFTNHLSAKEKRAFLTKEY